MFRQIYLKIIICLCIFSRTYVVSNEESFLLINGMTDEVISKQGSHIHTQMSPCSTFKIALSLMGYDTLILKDEKSPVWSFQEGYDDWRVSWKTPQTPRSWMKDSCIWYSKLLSIKIGLRKLQNYLTSMHYGNQDISAGLVIPGPLNPFWVNSSLKISPREQVNFIQKMIKVQLPVSTSAITMTKTILFKEELENRWKLFGKTGWSGAIISKTSENLEHGWFIGWVEKDQTFYAFAYLISGNQIHLDQRLSRVKQLLVEYKILI